MAMHKGDPYTTYRRRILAILALNAAAWMSLAASTLYFALSTTCTGLAALLASFLFSALALYLFADKLVPDWHSR